MEITWFGHSSFKIKGKGITLITDPYDPSMLGLKFPTGAFVEADIVTISHNHNDHNQAKLVGGNPKVVSGPGEYEVKGVSILGIHTWHDQKKGVERGENTVYSINMEGIRIVHLGDLGEKLSPEQQGLLGGVDILFVPTGGFYTIGPTEAAEVVLQTDPKVVIPMHYKTPALAAGFEKLSDISEFVREMGLEPKCLESYIISSDKLPQERELVILEQKS